MFALLLLGRITSIVSPAKWLN